MNRLQVLASHVATGCSPLVPVVEQPLSVPRSKRNWGGQVLFGQVKNSTPQTLHDLQEVVRATVGPLRVVGRGHSFSPICQVEGGTLVSLARFSRILSYCSPKAGQAGSVTFEGGATFTALCHFLSEQSPPTALKQLPSPLFVTVAGAMATGTHGSGIKNQALAAHAQKIEFVTADGGLASFDRQSSPVAVGHVAGCHVGCLGVVSQMTVDVVPYFDCHNFFLMMTLEKLLQHFSDLVPVDGRRPLVDSHSIIVNWRDGVCWINAKHFTPHYDPEIAARRPAYGKHPFGGLRWNLITPLTQDLPSTLMNAGVSLASGTNIVSGVLANSMAAEAGVEIGWILSSLEGRPVTDAAGSAAELFSEIVSSRHPEYLAEGDTSRFSGAAKISLVFQDPSIGHEETMPRVVPRLPAINFAFRGPWHDGVPAWALDQPLEDGPESNCGQQGEYFVPVENAVEALRAAWQVIRHWSVATDSPSKDNLSDGIFVLSEIRSIKGDQGFLSCTPHNTVSIHLSYSPCPTRQAELWSNIIDLERALEPLGARPHWGKIYTPSFWAPRFPELFGSNWQLFHSLRRKHDPEGKFVTPWIRETMFC